MVGIAGGLHCDGLSIGDIVISNTIYGYEYGKIDKQFIPRPNWVFAADIGLFTSISAFAELSPAWQETIDAERPLPGVPRVVSGNVASGDKVVDNPNNNFFRQVLANYPKTIAVEMEGAGAAQAIQNLRDAGIRVGFLMVRGISDMPREENVTDGENGQKERDRWKPYAAASAAAFLVAYIASGLPLSPGEPTDQPALSPAASVPMHDFQTSYFTGRKTELKKLLPLLQPGKTITIVGPAGVGKTTLVAEALAQLSAKGNLAQRFPDGTFFYSFQQRAEANIALEQIARWFGVDELVPDIGLAANRALKSKKALLILDGTEEADDLPRVLSVQNDCCMLVTTQSTKDVRGKSVVVGTLPEKPVDEGIVLLKKIAGRLVDDTQSAKKICDLVGRLPLALELAGKYLAQEQETGGNYLKWLEKATLKALETTQARRRTESVRILIQKSLERVSDQAKDILAIIGRLGLAPVPRILLASAFSVGEDELRAPLRELVNYGFLQARESWYSIGHRLIHTYAGAELAAPPGSIENMGSAMIRAFAMEDDGSNIWSLFTLLMKAHVLFLIEENRAIERWNLVEALANAVFSRFEMLGFWSDRRHLCTLGLDAARALGCRENEAEWLDNLGYAFSDVGEIDQAIAAHTQARAIYQELNLRKQESRPLYYLGKAYLYQGQAAKALEFYKDALSIAQEIQDEGLIGGISGGLGSCYRLLGDEETSIRYHQQALALHQKFNDRRAMGNDLGNLGNVYMETGNKEKAAELFKQSLTVAEDVGDLHGVASQLTHLGELYLNIDQTDTAENYLETGLVFFRDAGDRMREGAALVGLGSVRAKRDEIEQAIHFYEEALSIYRKLGLDDIQSKLLYQLGDANDAIGNNSKAIACYLETLDLQEKKGLPEINKGALLARLGKVHLEGMLPKESARYFSAALPYLLELDDKQGVVLVLTHLAVCYFLLGQPKKSIEYNEKALALIEECKQMHSIQSWNIIGLGMAHKALHNFPLANRYYLEAIALERADGKKSTEAFFLVLGGNAYLEQNNPAEAGNYFTQALDLYREIGFEQAKGWELMDVGNWFQKDHQGELALECYQAALRWHLAEFEGEWKLALVTNTGNAYLILDRFDEALACYDEALSLQDEAKGKAMQGSLLANIGFAHAKQKNYSDALKFFLRAEAIARRENERDLLLRLVFELAKAYQSQNEPEKAIPYALETIRMNREIGDLSTEGISTFLLASLYMDVNNYDKAAQFFIQTAVLCQRTGDHVREGGCLNMTAICYYLQRKSEQAETYANRALQIVGRYGSKDDVDEIMKFWNERKKFG